MCLERLMTEEEELALRESWDGKTVWKVVMKWRHPASTYTLGGLFPHTSMRDVSLGEWMEEEERHATLPTENWGGPGPSQHYPLGFHSFIRREAAEAYLSEVDYSYRRLAVVKCEVEEVVARGVQQIGVDHLNEVPAVVSRRIRILEEVSTPNRRC